MTTTVTQERIVHLDDWCAQELARINAPGIDLAIVNRSSYPTVTMDDLAGAQLGSLREVIRPSVKEKQIEHVLDEMGLAQISALASDMHRISVQFFQQFGIRQANLRVDLVDCQSCPKFHCDARKIRLITTYAGTTTQYRYAASGAQEQAFSLGAIGFLKGTTHPTHQGEHVLHRSPAVASGERRLCLVLDY